MTCDTSACNKIQLSSSILSFGGVLSGQYCSVLYRQHKILSRAMKQGAFCEHKIFSQMDSFLCVPLVFYAYLLLNSPPLYCYYFFAYWSFQLDWENFEGSLSSSISPRLGLSPYHKIGFP